MRLLRYGLVIGTLLVASARLGLAQSAEGPSGDGPPVVQTAPPPLASPATATPGPATSGDLATCLAEIENLREEQVALQAEPPSEEQKKRIELLQKQVETLEKMVKLLAEQIKKQPAGPAVEKLQSQTATLEGRSIQAAQRDRELANSIDDLREHTDAAERWGPQLPATLKELFLPSQTNESPLSIYGQLIGGFHQFNGSPGQFNSPDFAPFFLLTLNDQFLLEVELDINNAGISVSQAQLDWIVNDWLTVVGGRYLTPIGFFNERLVHEWINKLPDVPVMFRQVSPLSSTDGVQVRGAAYLGCTPVKLEYSVYGGNGFQFSDTPAGYSQAVDLEGLVGQPDEVDAKAIGGRLGVWVPAVGITAGLSVYYQNEYLAQTPNDIRLWQVDAGYAKGNWDFRFEFAQLFQQATAFIGNNVTRTGMYTQLAYRPRHANWRLLANTEVVARYSLARFKGIDPTQLDPTAFADRVGVPVNRNQYTFGINYYFYPSMTMRFAYEVNQELGAVQLHDNVFLAQFVWAF
jgi:hypothetical protein